MRGFFSYRWTRAPTEDVVERFLGSGVDDGNVGLVVPLALVYFYHAEAFFPFLYVGGRIPLAGGCVFGSGRSEAQASCKKGLAVGNRALICARRRVERVLVQLVAVMEYN